MHFFILAFQASVDQENQLLKTERCWFSFLGNVVTCKKKLPTLSQLPTASVVSPEPSQVFNSALSHFSTACRVSAISMTRKGKVLMRAQLNQACHPGVFCLKDTQGLHPKVPVAASKVCHRGVFGELSGEKNTNVQVGEESERRSSKRSVTVKQTEREQGSRL